MKKIFNIGISMMFYKKFIITFLLFNLFSNTKVNSQAYEDFNVTAGTKSIWFAIDGGRGGSAIIRDFEGFRCEQIGGAPAEISGRLIVGNGSNQIPIGSIIRVVYGQNGETEDITSTELEAATVSGGGGGSEGVLLQRPGSSTWELIAVAGGGGGAYAGHAIVCYEGPPKNGNVSLIGTDGGGDLSTGSGGINGNGGENGGTLSGGGGGYISNGQDMSGCSQSGGRSANPNGARGGVGCGGSNGGDGYTGGGASSATGAGGGGGGFSGGGGGGTTGGGGGGGSYFGSGYVHDLVFNKNNDDPPIELEPTDAPTARCQNLTVNLPSNDSAVTISPSQINNGSFDTDGTIVSYLLSQSVFSCNDLGSKTVTLTVTDNHGATGSCTATVAVLDLIKPTISCPTGIINLIAAQDQCTQTFNYNIIYNDNCTATLTRTRGFPSGLFPVGTTLTKYIVSDESENKDSCSFTVVVRDLQKPVLNCPTSPVINYVLPGTCTGELDWPLPTISDNCGGSFTATRTDESPTFRSLQPVGTYPISYYTEDPAGNFGTCNFSVQIVDNDPPKVNCPRDTVLIPDNTCYAFLNYTGMLQQTCDFQGSQFLQGASPGHPIGITTKEIEFSDIYGNKSTCKWTVSVNVRHDTIVSCGPYTFNGVTYTTSGDYVDTIEIYSCDRDSVIFINLMIQVPFRYYIDEDGDKYPGAILDACSNPGGPWKPGFPPFGSLIIGNNPLDCDDSDSTRHPVNRERCDNKDNDCNNIIDDGVLNVRYYLDADGDQYASQTKDTCDSPGSGWKTSIANSGVDCNDNSPSTHPGAPEVCDGKDNDCDGSIDEGIAMYYKDSDFDRYASLTKDTCASPGIGWILGTPPLSGIDCNDADTSIHPNAVEKCNGIDDNCDGLIDNGSIVKRFYYDADHDGYPVRVKDTCASPGPNWFLNLSSSADCNDGDTTIHPFALERCNRLDDDCDLQIDEGISIRYYLDSDKDGFSVRFKDTCASPGSQWVTTVRSTTLMDCNDAVASINPMATDSSCNGIDENCNGLIDEGYIPTNCNACVNGALQNSVANLPVANLRVVTNIQVQDTIVVTIAWDLNNVFNSYSVEYRLSNTSLPWNVISNITSNSFTIKSLTQNTAYDFRVRGRCVNNWGRYTTISLVTSAIPCVSAPANVTTTNITHNSAILSWGAVSGAITYTIQRYFPNTLTWSTIASISQTSYNWTNLTPQTTYYWRVWANCTNGSSPTVNKDFKTGVAPQASCPGSEDTEPNNSILTAVAIPFNTVIKGRLSVAGDKDYYRFVIRTSGGIQAALKNLPADYDLRLYNSAGVSVAVSSQWLTLNEVINVTLQPGTYYAAVYSTTNLFNATACYDLSIDLKGATLVSDEPSLESRDVKSLSINTWPSPVKDKMYLNVEGITEKYTVDLFTIEGKKLQSFKLNGNLNAIDLNNLSAGAYILHVISDQDRKAIKILKQ